MEVDELEELAVEPRDVVELDKLEDELDEGVELEVVELVVTTSTVEDSVVEDLVVLDTLDVVVALDVLDVVVGSQSGFTPLFSTGLPRTRPAPRIWDATKT